LHGVTHTNEDLPERDLSHLELQNRL
jgi:hypothetical protein